MTQNLKKNNDKKSNRTFYNNLNEPPIWMTTEDMVELTEALQNAEDALERNR